MPQLKRKLLPFASVVTIVVILVYFASGNSEKYRLVEDSQAAKPSRQSTRITTISQPSETLAQEHSDTIAWNAGNDTPTGKSPFGISKEAFDTAVENSRAWLSHRGYFFMEEYLEPKEQETDEVITNEYHSYSISELKVLAESQDAKAQMYYGFSLLQENIQEAEQWLKKAIAIRGYTSVIPKLMDAYQLKINAIKDQQRKKTATEFTPPDADRIDLYKVKLYAWGLVSKQLNDPFGYRDLYVLYQGAEFSARQVDAGKHQAQTLYVDIKQTQDLFTYSTPKEPTLTQEDFDSLYYYLGDEHE